MKENRRRWYGKGLAPRIDALVGALKGVRARDPAAAESLRKQSQSLRTSAEAYGFATIAVAARETEEAREDELEERAQALIELLRRQAAGSPPQSATILLVGGERSFVDALVAKFEPPAREAIAVATAREALQVLAEREIVFVVLDLFLPDQDGRHLLAALRSKPFTATIPIAVLTPKVSEESRDQSLVNDVDGVFEKPADAQQVADFVSTRLRRAREVVRAAHRDALTGLLNRAAFCDVFERAMRSYDSGREPLALAMLEIDEFKALQEAHGSATADAILRQVGALLSSVLRATDTVARWGVFEFVTLFPGEDQFGGGRALEKVMTTLRKTGVTTPDGKTLSVTLSAGLTVISERTTVEEAIERAGRYLYTAVSSGGGRLASEETDEGTARDRVAILVADPLMGRAMKQLLDRGGFESEWIEKTGEDAIAELMQARFQLLILEDKLPGVTGYALLERLRAMARFDRIPILVVTTSEESTVRALELGANDYLVKPFSPFAFVQRLRRILSHGRSGKRASTGLHSVLVVDDETAHLVIAGTALDKLGGLRVLLARGWQDGLKRVQDEKPDAVILDLGMPDTTPMELLKLYLRSMDPERTALILAADAKTAQQVPRDTPPHVKGSIAKPYNPQTIAKDVRSLLNLGEPTAKAAPSDGSHLNREIQRVVQAADIIRPPQG
jgi:diguanylate cyclase (GGDEF)-like protein